MVWSGRSSMKRAPGRQGRVEVAMGSRVRGHSSSAVGTERVTTALARRLPVIFRPLIW